MEVSVKPKKKHPAALDENQTHSLVIGQGREVGEGLGGGSIPHSLLHRQDSNSVRQYTSGLAAHTHTHACTEEIMFAIDWNC